MFDTPGPPGDAAGLRAANARLRELLAGRDAEIAALRARVAQAEGLVADLREQVAGLAARVGQNFEFLEAAVVGRAGKAGAEVAAAEDRPEAGPAEGAAGRDDAADRAS